VKEPAWNREKFNEKEGFDVKIMPVAAWSGLKRDGSQPWSSFQPAMNLLRKTRRQTCVPIGQSKPVYVYYLIARHPRPEIRSFDDNLAQLLSEKRSLRGAVLYPTGMREVKPEDIFRETVKYADESI
jgi:hypothetical protein